MSDTIECAADAAAVGMREFTASGHQSASDLSGFLWSVAIFAAREQPGELIATIGSIVQAASQPTVIDVMVNGNHELAAEIGKRIAMTPIVVDSIRIRVWSIPLGGKAHAWNEYVHLVWPGTRLAFFVDGYARPRLDAFELLAAGVASAPAALAGTGVPSSGRTAHKLGAEMLREGGLQGSFFVLKESVMNEFRDSGFRLPLGLYGFDTLLGAVLAFGLDPSKNQWNAKGCILIHPEVTWTSDKKNWWRPSVVRTQYKRILNNALRVLVIQATKNYLAQRKLPPEQLPRTVEDFVLGWVNDNPDDARKTLRESPLSRLALAKLREPRNWSVAKQAPKLIYASRGTT